MEVKVISRDRTFSYDDSRYGVEPDRAFREEEVVHENKLQPFVDRHLPQSSWTDAKKDKKKSIKMSSSLPLIKPKATRARDFVGSARIHNPSVSVYPTKRDALVKRNPIPIDKNKMRRIPTLLSKGLKSPPSLHPSQTSDINISHGLRDYDNGELRMAIKKLTRAVGQQPHAFLPRFVRGLCHAQRNKFSKAVDDFSACCRIDPDSAISYYNRGVAQSSLFNFAEAKDDFTMAIKLDKNDKDAYINRAMLHRRNGDYQLAQRDYASVRNVGKQAGGTLGGIIDATNGQPGDFPESLKNSWDGFKPIDSDNENETGKKVGMASSIALPKIGSNGKPSESLEMDAAKKRSTMRKTKRATRKTRHNVTKGGSPPKNLYISKADEERKQKELKAKIYGMVHLALTEVPDARTPAQLDLLVAESRLMSAFAHLDAKELRTLWQFLTYRKFNSGKRLFEMGDEATNFYVVWSGQVSARIPSNSSPVMGRSPSPEAGGFSAFLKKHSGLETELTVNLMNAGDTLGEAVGHGEEAYRKAACVTEQPTELLVLNQHGFNKTFKIFFEKRERDKMLFLKNLSCFGGNQWSEDEILKLAHYCREQEFRAGNAIVTQDQSCEGLYFIQSGLVTVLRNINGIFDDEGKPSMCTVAVTKLCSGECFGETTVLDMNSGSAYPSTIICETLVKCLRIDKAQLKGKKWQDENVQAVLKEASVRYPDDNVLLQAHIDMRRSQTRKKKVMLEMHGTMKRRGRKDERRMK